MMKLSDANHFTVILGLILFSMLSSFLPQEGRITYFQKPTISEDYHQEQTLLIGFEDTSSNDSVFLLKTKGNIPLHYFKDIITEVCFNHECRLLRAKIYWNITGRYQGFELSEGEYFSKREHEPFSKIEYEKLNDLLADPTLPLGGISFEDLIESPDSNSIDGVSGASTKAISEIVVKGAAYTTYTLWNIVYGSTMVLIENETEKQLSPELIDLILKSPDIQDRIWVLERISDKTILTPRLTTTLLDIISGNDFYLSYSAINAIHSSHLDSEAFQMALFSIYREANHSIQRMLIDKLTEAPFLSSELIKASRNLLTELNGNQLGDILKLYRKHSIDDLEVFKVVAEISRNENPFISRQAHKFLKESNFTDQEIEKLIQN